MAIKRDEFEGIVQSATVERTRARDSGRYGSERWDVRLSIRMETVGGLAVFFRTPAATESVACAGPAAVATVHFGGTSGDWLRKEGEHAVAVSPWMDPEGAKLVGSRLDVCAAPSIAAGDYIRVTGRQRGSVRVSRKGMAYVTLTHVRREDWAAAGSFGPPPGNAYAAF